MSAESLREAEFLSKVASLRLRGFTEGEIAVRLGIETEDVNGRARVEKALRHAEDQWKRSTQRDFEQDKGRALAELQLLKSELWQAWERSKKRRVQTQDTYSVKAKVKAGDIIDTAEQLSEDERAELAEAMSGVQTPQDRERKRTVEQRDGNPQFAKCILDVIDKELTLLGIGAAEAGGDTAPPVVGFRIHAPGNEAGDESGAENAGTDPVDPSYHP
jgi:uncharacterized membrane protein